MHLSVLENLSLRLRRQRARMCGADYNLGILEDDRRYPIHKNIWMQRPKVDTL